MSKTNTYKNVEDLPLVLDVDDIKKILNIGRKQAYELANSKKFHTVRINRRIKIPRDSFLKWLYGENNNNGIPF